MYLPGGITLFLHWLRTSLMCNDGNIKKVYLNAFYDEETPSIEFCFKAYSSVLPKFKKKYRNPAFSYFDIS